MGILSKLLKTLTQQPWLKRLTTVLISGLLSIGLWGCATRTQSVRLVELPDVLNGVEVRRLSGAVSEVAPPAVLLDLATLSGQYRPQVTITSPKANQVIETDGVEVRIKLKGLSIYKDKDLALGPHLQVILDHQPARSVYSLEDAVVFEDIPPGSHTLQVVAVQPWGESFKNEEAYAQATFHVLAETGENTPNPSRPLLTYIEPQGTYGAEPVLLDFYLNNAPLHQIAEQSDSDDIDWQIRCSVNGQSFVFDQWQPIYIRGLTPGQNWIQLTLIDRQGNPIENAFNSTVRTFIYDPNQRDSLAEIIRGELPLDKVGQIVDASYKPPAPAVETPNTVEPGVEVEVKTGEGIEDESVEIEQAQSQSEDAEALKAEPTQFDVDQLDESISDESTVEQDLPASERSDLETPSKFQKFGQFLKSQSQDAEETEVEEPEESTESSSRVDNTVTSDEPESSQDSETQATDLNEPEEVDSLSSDALNEDVIGGEKDSEAAVKEARTEDTLEASPPLDSEIAPSKVDNTGVADENSTTSIEATEPDRPFSRLGKQVKSLFQPPSTSSTAREDTDSPLAGEQVLPAERQPEEPQAEDSAVDRLPAADAKMSTGVDLGEESLLQAKDMLPEEQQVQIEPEMQEAPELTAEPPFEIETKTDLRKRVELETVEPASFKNLAVPKTLSEPDEPTESVVAPLPQQTSSGTN